MKYSLEQLPEEVGKIHNRLDRIEKLIEEKFPGQQPLETPVDVKGAAKFLNISVASLYCKVSRREIPYSKKGKRLYFFITELTEWLRTGRRETEEEIGQTVIERFAEKHKRPANRFF